MGAHHPRHAAADSGTLRRLAVAVIAPLAVATLAAMVWLWPSEPITANDDAASAAESQGRVTSITREACREALTDDVNGCGAAVVTIEDADGQERQVETLLPNGAGAPEIDEGDDVVLIETEGPDGSTYSIVDHQRGFELWVLWRRPSRWR